MGSCRPSEPNGTRADGALCALVVIVAVAVGGCGEDEDAAAPETTTSSTVVEGSDPARSPACRAVSAAAVRRAVVRAGGPRRPLERSANDSLDLSICEFRETRGPDLFVTLTIDTAPKTARRYYNLIAEARQRATFAAIPDSTQPVGVRGVGNDRTHGGVGAYWTRYRSQLTAIDDGKLVKIGFHVPGADQEASRAAATKLALAVLAGPA